MNHYLSRVPVIACALMLLLLGGRCPAAEDALADFTAALRNWEDSSTEQRQALARSLAQTHDGQAPAQVERALTSALRNLQREVSRQLGSGTARAAAGKLTSQLEPLRGQALAAISDYNQGRIDAAAEQMRSLWNDPLATIDGAGETLAALQVRAEELQALAGHFPALSDQLSVPDIAEMRQQLGQAIRMAAAPQGAEAVMNYNESRPYLDSEERAHLSQLNNYRMMLGRMPLESDVRLYRAARGHSRDMAEQGFFSHDSPLPGKRSVADRGNKEGYRGAAGENILRGQDRGIAAFNGWYHSPGHHRNMVNERYTQIGAARHRGFWTQKFGRGRHNSAGRPDATLQALEEITAIGSNDEATLDELRRVASLAAGAGRWEDAESLLSRAAALAPEDQGLQRALERVQQEQKNAMP